MVANVASVVARAQSRGLAVPVVCAGLALVAAGLRFTFARSVPGPWYVDEFLYAGSARAISSDWGLLVRYFGGAFYLYPRLLAPAWTASSMATTYELAQAINAVLITLAVVPVYLWSRRLLPPLGRVVMVALLLVMPTGLYVIALVTENAFFPAFLLAAFAIAAALERPTIRSQLLALFAIGLAVSIRLQGLVFALIVPSAIGFKIALDLRDSNTPFTRAAVARELRRFLPTLVVGLAVACAYAIWKLSTGAAFSGALGIYAPAVDLHNYSAAQAFRWVLYHFGALAIVVGLVPFSALILFTGAVVRKEIATSAAERAFLAVSTSAVVWVAIQVGIFSSRRAERISERYMFHVEPLLLLALLVWINRGAPRRRPTIAVLLPVALILTVPLEQLLANPGVLSETFGFLPLVRASHYLHGVEEVRILLAAAGDCRGGGHRRAAIPRPADRRAHRGLPLPPCGFTHDRRPVTGVREGFRQGVRVGHDPEWVDHAVPRNASVDVITTGAQDPTLLKLRLRLMHFWNRRVTIVHEFIKPVGDVLCRPGSRPGRQRYRSIVLAGYAGARLRRRDTAHKRQARGNRGPSVPARGPIPDRETAAAA